MSVNDDPSVEMELFASFEQPLSAADAERLLAGRGVGPDAPEDQRALAMMLRHAAAPASTQELAGEISAVAVFALLKEQKTRRARARRRPLLAACASAAIVMVLSGTAAANALPAPMQRVAHDTFGAPAPRRPAPSVSTTPGVRREQHHPAAPHATPVKPTSGKSPHGNGKAAGKAKPAKPVPPGKAKPAKPAPPGKAVGKAKPAKPAPPGKAKPVPHGPVKPVPPGKAMPAKPVAPGVAKGHTAAHGHK
jgi:hypothetical protein